MFFLTVGRMLYLHKDSQPFHVCGGKWANEMSLWTLWVYHGTMRAKSDCRVLLLDAQKFQKVACQFMAREGANPLPYANLFLRKLNLKERIHLTDLEDPTMDLRGMVQKVFGNVARRASVAQMPMRFSSDSSGS